MGEFLTTHSFFRADNRHIRSTEPLSSVFHTASNGRCDLSSDPKEYFVKTALRSLIQGLPTGLLVVLLGCGKSEPGSGGSADPEPSGSRVSGNAVYDQHCAKCHVFRGEGPKMVKAPNLAKVAADPAHTPDWLAEHVKNPKSHKPGSTMPPFEGKLSADELKSVTEFLSTLK